ncbi:PIN domain-containing protein [Methanobacterium spitsbergense]|uniref:N-acetyltransferase domain-containing protein n=1 Tax=Methanobacterium spitsbergense TaxID=2874285 RepID=A0A8T5UTB9_9EURY|nr:PIN domain-containing protein [Methanobacterium spitsbergense]MBZ2165216.1 hypothetical protein [Methanobacterium spitsbergense]
MRVLTDTNIFILREDNSVVSENLQNLLRILNKESVTILIHPISKAEIKKDKDKDRKKVSLSKIETYPLLESPPNPIGDNEYLTVVGKPKNSHDINDNIILYSVYKNAVDFFITEDRGIHKKASKLGIEDRVFTLDEALTTFEEMFKEFQPPYPPAIAAKKVYNLDVNDEIFDSLRDEYDGFDEWFIDISKEGRDCWVHFNSDESIGAVLIYKQEDDIIELKDKTLDKKKRVKISTFKAKKTGFKIGELFLKLSIEFALKNNATEIYLTHFSKPDDHLVELITDYGFSYVGKNRRYEDDVYLKELNPSKEDLKHLFDSDGPVKVAKTFYPHFYDGTEVNKFIVPIRPEFHHRLYVDYKGRQTTIPEFSNEFIIEGNTIKKAYICNSVRINMNPGDLLFFYRSHDVKELTTIGVVEKVFIDKNKEDIIKIVGKRTVYTNKEIEEISKKRTFVILFIMVFHLPKSIKLEELKKANVLKAAPQSIINVTDKYITIKELGDINGRFTFD